MDNACYKIKRKSDGLFYQNKGYTNWTSEGKSYPKKGHVKAAITSLLSGAARTASWKFRYDSKDYEVEAKAVAEAVRTLTDDLEVVEYLITPAATYSAEDFRSL